jgi:hypothetical protein
MQALVSRWEIKKFAEQYPNFLDCPPYVFIEVTAGTHRRSGKASDRRTEARYTAQDESKAIGLSSLNDFYCDTDGQKEKAKTKSN